MKIFVLGKVGRHEGRAVGEGVIGEVLVWCFGECKDVRVSKVWG